jgi:hypothetical protein
LVKPVDANFQIHSNKSFFDYFSFFGSFDPKIAIMIEAISSRQSFSAISLHDQKILIEYLLERMTFVGDMFKEHIFLNMLYQPVKLFFVVTF